MLRLFTLSDTHTAPWADGIDANVDAVLFAGDLGDGAAIDARDEPPTDPEALAWTRRMIGLPATRGFRCPVVAVRGNHDVADPARFFTGDAVDVSEGTLHQLADGLWVAGVGWHGERYFELPSESDLQPRCDAVLRAAQRLVLPRDRLVLLMHYPPALPPLSPEVLPWRTYAVLAELVRRLRPIAVIAGHEHKWAGQVVKPEWDGGETLLVFPGSQGMMLHVEGDRVEVVATT